MCGFFFNFLFCLFKNVTLVSAIDIYEDEEAELLLSYNCKYNWYITCPTCK